MGDLYDTDILLWSERQAGLLRRHAAGERANDAALDWENITDEVESVGRSELQRTESLLVRALRHPAGAGTHPQPHSRALTQR